MSNSNFSVGELHGWHGVLLGLLASAAFLISGLQDLRVLRFSLGAVFCFFLALLSAGGVVWLGIGAGIFGAALLGGTIFCLEVWLIRRSWRKDDSMDPSERSRDRL